MNKARVETIVDTALGSPEGQAAVADLGNFATRGVTMVIGTV